MNSPVGESQSNGLAEKAAQDVQYQIRKMKMQLEQNMASKLSNESPIWPWLIQYAAQVIHTFKIHPSDQRTARQRIRANPSIPEIPKFGENVYFKPAKTVMLAKDEARWRSGLWLGFIDHTNEHLIGTPKGVLKCRAIRRHDASEQFDAQMVENIRGTPWRPVPGRDSLKVPTNVEENGEVIDEDGEVEGYAEENENLDERFSPGIDKEQDEEFERKLNEENYNRTNLFSILWL